MRRFTYRGLAIGQGEPFIFSPTVTGEGTGTTEREALTFYGVDGESIGAQTYEARTVTIDGHIMAENETELQALRRRLIAACDGKTIADLQYWNGISRYHAPAVADLPIFGQKVIHTAPFALVFSINFRIPGFYWYGNTQTLSVFERRDMIAGDFTLPEVFTERTMKRVIPNDGMVETPFRATATVYGSIDGFSITKEGTAETITVDQALEDGDTVTIDTDALTVTSPRLGNIINCVTASSAIDMTIPVGGATLSGNYTGSGGIAINVDIEPRYIGV